jgi:tetratricopeptide (TPR) repeat protein
MNTRLLTALRAGALLAMALVAAAPAHLAHADSSQAVFARANALLYRGEARRAAAEYQMLIDAGVDDAAVFTNQGIAFLGTRQSGYAILAFERALERQPWSGSAIRGLEIARAQINAQVKGSPSNTGNTVWVESRAAALRKLLRPIPEGTAAWMLLAANALFFVALGLGAFARRATVRLALGFAAPALGLALAALAGLLAVKRGVFEDGAPAIVVAPRAVLRSGPDELAPEEERLFEGEETQIVGEHGAFREVLSPRGKRGWVERRSVLPL